MAELIDALKDGGITTPAMLFEATRDSRYADLYQSIAGEMLTGSIAAKRQKRTWPVRSRRWNASTWNPNTSG